MSLHILAEYLILALVCEFIAKEPYLHFSDLNETETFQMTLIKHVQHCAS